MAVQREEDEPPKNPLNNSDYETRAINILNKPRKGWYISALFYFAVWLTKVKIQTSAKKHYVKSLL